MPFVRRPRFEWKLRSRSLPLGARTLIMGILNVTPDSFSDGGRFPDSNAAVRAALAMLDAGAAIVDVGGESTRPGAEASVSAAEEIDRVVPVIEGVLSYRADAILSIDTYKAETARAALRAGVEIVNDVSGFLWDPGLAAVCAQGACGVVLTHTRGRPWEWKSLPDLDPRAVLPLVIAELRQRMQVAQAAGLPPDCLVLDPGFGFGKRMDRNFILLAGLERLQVLERPLLAGLSRKSFLGRAIAPLGAGNDLTAADRGAASLSAATAAILAGASILRVHDVRPSMEAAVIADAVLAGAEAQWEARQDGE